MQGISLSMLRYWFTIFTGVDGQYTVTIVSTPAGTPVSGSTNTFDYPILSNVTLTCMVNPSPPASATYQWNTGCFTNNRHAVQACFPVYQTTQSVTGYHLLAEDAGAIACIVTIGGTDYDSDLFGLRISGTCTLLLHRAVVMSLTI